MVGAKTVDPGSDFVGIDIQACIEFSTSFGDALSFPGEAGLKLGLGLDGVGNGGGLGHEVNISQAQVDV